MSRYETEASASARANGTEERDHQGNDGKQALYPKKLSEMSKHCDPLELLYRLRLDVPQPAVSPRKATRRPTDLPVLVEMLEGVPDVRVARLDPGHLGVAVGPRREQGHDFQRGCAEIVPDERLKVRVLLSRRGLGLVLCRHG
jgi:hypothetical protein